MMKFLQKSTKDAKGKMEAGSPTESDLIQPARRLEAGGFAFAKASAYVKTPARRDGAARRPDFARLSFWNRVIMEGEASGHMELFL